MLCSFQKLLNSIVRPYRNRHSDPSGVGGCPLMFCSPVDPFHWCMKKILQWRAVVLRCGRLFRGSTGLNGSWIRLRVPPIPTAGCADHATSASIGILTLEVVQSLGAGQ